MIGIKTAKPTRTRIDAAAVYARLNRPRAALPETRSGLCVETCDEERQGRDPCAWIQCARLLEPSKSDNVHAQARRPRTFAEMARDCYGVNPITPTTKETER